MRVRLCVPATIAALLSVGSGWRPYDTFLKLSLIAEPKRDLIQYLKSLYLGFHSTREILKCQPQVRT
jgi:hypothetical protein